jgi:hypothetical protein
VRLDAIGILIFGIKYNYLDSGRNRAIPVVTSCRSRLDAKRKSFLLRIVAAARPNGCRVRTSGTYDAPRCTVTDHTTGYRGGMGGVHVSTKSALFPLPPMTVTTEMHFDRYPFPTNHLSTETKSITKNSLVTTVLCALDIAI